MKKILATVSAALIAVGAMAGGLNTYDGITYTNLLKQTRVPVATAITGAAINVTAYKGIGTVIVSLAAGDTNITSFGASVNIQESSTGTGGWTNISALATTAATNVGVSTAYKVDMSTIKNYLRVVASATNDSSVVSSILSAYQ